ncbi:polysaccharide biosynthesis tyrosine autokinase [Klebsiella pneumoniae]|uniref:polysaccharide biosynthesis tyrosine autokinase n=1 Tax=Klebsiella pneumoniae TaxID=573 RepID=UPI003F66F24E
MSSIINKSADKSSEEIELIKLLGEFIDHRRIIVSITAFFVLLSVLYTLFSTPVYQADAMVQIQQKQGNAILSNITQMLPDSQPLSAPEITLLQSRMILGKTVDDLNLQANVTEDHFPVFGRGWARIMGQAPGEINLSQFYLPEKISKENNDELILTVLDSANFKITGETINFTGKVGELYDKDGMLLKVDNIDAKVGTTFTINYLTKLQAISQLQKKFTASDASKDSGMLQLTYQDTNAVLAQKILQSIIDNYLAQNVALQAAQDEKSLDFLNKQLPKVRNDLDSAEDLLNNYRQKKDSVDLTMEAKSVLDQIVNVDNQLNELTFKEAEISQLFTREHPTYKALMEKRKTLQDEKAKLNQRVSLMPETQQEVLRLSRDVDSGKAVYMQLLTKQQELSIAKSSVIGNVRIVDSAITQPKPVKPNAILVIFVGIVLGLIISSGLVLIRIFIRKGVESPEQLEELGVNVYASVPVSESLAKKTGRNKNNISYDSGPLAIENPADLAIEAIRGLRTSLHFAMMEAKNKILMISGATPDAGKTFISTNLSVIISTTGKKVLLIDADMRKGYVHKLFSNSNDNGLSNYLSGKSSLTEVVKRTKYDGIDFIPRGMVPPNPAELLMHSRFEELISWADRNYDIVIIDTPPVLAVTDPVIIGRYAGTVLLVARFEKNTIKEIEVSVRRFEQNGIPIKGCILNGLVKKASGYYGYGYNHYGYEYKDKK